MANKWGNLFRREAGWRAFIKSPSFVMLMVSVAILSACIVFIGHWRPFNSDDLYWQETVRTWRPFSGNTFYFGTKDIFVGLAPFFWVMEHLFNPSRRLLIVETVILTATSFTMSYFAVLYFLRKLKIEATYLTLLPFVWLASFGYPLVQNYLNSDWRTFQIGFSFATFALVAAYLNRDFNPLRTVRGRILTGLGILVTAVLMYGDPYYTIFTFGPLILFTGGLYVAKKIAAKELLTIFLGIFASLVAAKILALLCAKAGIHIVMSTPSIFVSFDNIVDNIIASLHGLLIIFGADFFGREVASAVTVGFLFNALVLSFILYSAYALRKLANKRAAAQASLPQLWPVFFAITMAFVFLVYTSSSLAVVSNYRFYILFVYCAVALLMFAMGSLKNRKYRWGLAGIIVVATLFNLAYTALAVKNTPGDIAVNRSNWLNYALIHEIEAQGLTKGYASYWQANVNTYLSNNRVTFLPSLCNGDTTSEFRWLIDAGQFSRKANKSFYLIDPDIPAPPICTQKELVAQFGEPEKVFQVSNKTILVFNYDITSKMK